MNLGWEQGLGRSGKPRSRVLCKRRGRRRSSLSIRGIYKGAFILKSPNYWMIAVKCLTYGNFFLDAEKSTIKCFVFFFKRKDVNYFLMSSA